MNKEDVWKILNDKYPTGAHLTNRGMRTFFDTVWDASEKESQKLMQEIMNESNRSMPEFMKGLFYP